MTPAGEASSTSTMLKICRNRRDVKVVVGKPPQPVAGGEQLVPEVGVVRDGGVGFQLLSDPDLRAAHAYGVAYRQEGKSGLPVPAVFIVDTDRHVQFEYVNPRYQVRLGRDVLLAAARGLAH